MRLLDFMPRCRLVAAIHLCFQVCRSGARCGDSRSSRQECRPRQGGGTGRTRHRIPRGGTALSRRGPSCQPRAVFDRGAPHPMPAAALRLRARRGRRAHGPRSRRQAPDTGQGPSAARIEAVVSASAKAKPSRSPPSPYYRLQLRDVLRLGQSRPGGRLNRWNWIGHRIDPRRKIDERFRRVGEQTPRFDEASSHGGPSQTRARCQY